MEDDSDEDEPDTAVVSSSSQTSPENMKLRVEESLPKLDSLSLAETMIAGFNGRPNKIADTCYSWWNTGALSVWNTCLLQTYAHLIVDVEAG
jgi:geranylgeranyl transferase type-1 subunit beta